MWIFLSTLHVMAKTSIIIMKSGVIKKTVMVPLRSLVIQTTRDYVVLSLKMRCTVQLLMSGLCHPQLEGLQDTWPVTV